MSDRPAFHCGADGCCEGASYPECQNIPVTESRFVYDPNQEYTHHQFTD